MEGIKFFSASQFCAKLKATIQVTGKLGFSDDAAKDLGLSSNTYIKLGIDENNPNTMYLVVSQEPNVDSFKVCKAGAYFYLPTTMLFSSIGYDFKNKTIIFDLTRDSEHDTEFGGIVYKANKREIYRKKHNK